VEESSQRFKDGEDQRHRRREDTRESRCKVPRGDSLAAKWGEGWADQYDSVVIIGWGTGSRLRRTHIHDLAGPTRHAADGQKERDDDNEEATRAKRSIDRELQTAAVGEELAGQTSARSQDVQESKWVILRGAWTVRCSLPPKGWCHQAIVLIYLVREKEDPGPSLAPMPPDHPPGSSRQRRS
jgi:hypothetical protein